MKEQVNHPEHYGGEDNPYEAIKVVEAWELDFCLGNVVKYISRAGKKESDKELQDLNKAKWYLERRIAQLESPIADLVQPENVEFYSCYRCKQIFCTCVERSDWPTVYGVGATISQSVVDNICKASHLCNQCTYYDAKSSTCKQNYVRPNL